MSGQFSPFVRSTLTPLTAPSPPPYARLVPVAMATTNGVPPLPSLAAIQPTTTSSKFSIEAHMAFVEATRDKMFLEREAKKSVPPEAEAAAASSLLEVASPLSPPAEPPKLPSPAPQPVQPPISLDAVPRIPLFAQKIRTTPPSTPRSQSTTPTRAVATSPSQCPFCPKSLLGIPPYKVGVHLRNEHTHAQFYNYMKWLSWHDLVPCTLCHLPFGVGNAGMGKHHPSCDGIRESDDARAARRAGRNPPAAKADAKPVTPVSPALQKCPIPGCGRRHVNSDLSKHLRAYHSRFGVDYRPFSEELLRRDTILCPQCNEPFHGQTGLSAHYRRNACRRPKTPMTERQAVKMTMAATAPKSAPVSKRSSPRGEESKPTAKRSKGWHYVSDDDAGTPVRHVLSQHEEEDDDDDNYEPPRMWPPKTANHSIDAMRRIYQFHIQGGIGAGEMAKMIAALPK